MRNSLVSSSAPLQRPSLHATLKAVYWIVPLGLLAGHLRAQAPSGSDQKSDQKTEKEFYSAKDRLQAIRNATIFSPKPVSEVDMLQGPPQEAHQFQLHFNDKVICDFAVPGSQMGGKTQKFGCKITRVESPNGEVQVLGAQMDEEPVKVKFGGGDNEVFAEVASSRLMAALGFYADGWFPVRVECHNCPSDPESGHGAVDTRMFDPAIIVRKFKGHKMYEVGKEDEGWSWKELAEDNGRPTYERDGLALLGAFIVHSDNKPPQQRLVCDHVKVDETTHPFTTTCEKSKMLVQDVGATFGGGGLFTNNDSAKMNLDDWSGSGLWKKVGSSASDCPVCQARLRKSLTAKDGLEDPIVSEEGRRFLAGLMCQLSDAQIKTLFRVARVAQMPKYHNSDGSFKSSLNEDLIVQQWVDAFKKKREALAAGRCKWKSQPADMKLVDNPAALATVPNYCSAHPF
jgi:hypothetical protein